MAEIRFHSSPLKIGLLTVAFAYFLFTFHAMFTLSWIGEWEDLNSTLGFVIFVEDIAASIGLVLRFAASLTALAAVLIYFIRKGLPLQIIRKILQVILVGEAIYWLGLLPSGVMPLIFLRGFGAHSTLWVLTSVISSDIPCLVESIAIPVALFILASKLSPNKPEQGAIKWGLIAGTVYVFVFWLVNSGMWIIAIRQKGIEYLTSHPENLLSFASTTIGLLALTIFTFFFLKKSSKVETLNALRWRTAGAIITVLGLYFLWNYLTWIFFGRDELWSAWYAWFLGHNMDLWLLSIPLVGVPLLFERKTLSLGIDQKSVEKKNEYGAGAPPYVN